MFVNLEYKERIGVCLQDTQKWMSLQQYVMQEDSVQYLSETLRKVLSEGLEKPAGRVQGQSFVPWLVSVWHMLQLWSPLMTLIVSAAELSKSTYFITYLYRVPVEKEKRAFSTGGFLKCNRSTEFARADSLMGTIWEVQGCEYLLVLAKSHSLKIDKPSEGHAL